MTTPEKPIAGKLEKKCKEKEFDPVHTRWTIDQRAHIQHTLLALYEYLEEHNPNVEPWAHTSFVDDLIAAAFSLWRAAFLAENQRLFDTIQAAQRKFLHKVVTTNAITFTDDLNSDAWTFGYYLFNAWYRLKNAKSQVLGSLSAEENATLDHCFHIHAVADAVGNRYQWQLLHAAIRILFKQLDRAPPLLVQLPDPIPGHPNYG